MVSFKTGIQLTGLIAVLLAVFLVVRGGGQFLKDLTNPFAGLELPELPELPDTAGFFAGLQEQFDKFVAGFTPLEQPQKMVEDTGLFTPAQLEECQCGSSIVQDAFGNVNQQCKVCDDGGNAGAIDDQLPSLDPSKNVPDSGGFVGGIGGGLLDFLGLTPAQKFVQDKIAQNQLPSGFTGGGPSFIGGSIFQTPIQNLTLSQIIDKFNVSASQAANIKAIAGDDFGNFDFGTNTGGCIGSVFQTIQELRCLVGNVYDYQLTVIISFEIHHTHTLSESTAT